MLGAVGEAFMNHYVFAFFAFGVFTLVTYAIWWFFDILTGPNRLSSGLGFFFGGLVWGAIVVAFDRRPQFHLLLWVVAIGCSVICGWATQRFWGIINETE